MNVMSADAQLKNGLISLFGLDALWIIEHRHARTTKTEHLNEPWQ
jgi:hypothetical protein